MAAQFALRSNPQGRTPASAEMRRGQQDHLGYIRRE